MTSPPSPPQPSLRFITKVIKSIDDDIFIFHCTAKFQDTYKINRNMIVLKSPSKAKGKGKTKGNSLTLINPLVLTPGGETALRKLGSVDNIMRLGGTHSCFSHDRGTAHCEDPDSFLRNDDAEAAAADHYYLTEFPRCQRWAPGPFANCPHLPIHCVLQKGVDLPHPNAHCFVVKCFDDKREALLLMERPLTGDHILIAGDCLQYQANNPYVSPRTLHQLQSAGYIPDSNDNESNDVDNDQGQVVVSPAWFQAMVSPLSSSLSVSCMSASSLSLSASSSSSGSSSSGSLTPPKRPGSIYKSLRRMATKAQFTRFISTSGNVMLKDIINGNNTTKQAVITAIDRAFGRQHNKTPQQTENIATTTTSIAAAKTTKTCVCATPPSPATSCVTSQRRTANY